MEAPPRAACWNGALSCEEFGVSARSCGEVTLIFVQFLLILQG